MYEFVQDYNWFAVRLSSLTSKKKSQSSRFIFHCVVLYRTGNMGSFRRLRDVGYALFFLFHLAVIVLFNAQLVLDKKLFPKQVGKYTNKLCVILRPFVSRVVDRLQG